MAAIGSCPSSTAATATLLSEWPCGREAGSLFGGILGLGLLLKQDRLFARPRPARVGSDSTAQALFEAFKAVSGSEELARANLRAVFDRLERVHGFRLSHEDEDDIKAVNQSFYISGPDIRWDPDGGSWIPSYAELMAQTDPRGRDHSYLATEENARRRTIGTRRDFGAD